MLVDKQIEERGESLIFPFEETHVNSVSYDLDIEGRVNMEGKIEKNSFCLHPNETVLIKTVQNLDMPNDLVGIIGERNSRIRQGLQVSGPRYFPGHKTSIYLRVTNLSPFDIDIQPNTGIAQIFFEELKERPEKSYKEQEGASFNDELEYRGYGHYNAEYKKQMRSI